MTQNKVRILHIEDNFLDSELIKSIVSESGIDCTVMHVKKESEFKNALKKQEFDIILTDYTLPSWSGVEAMNYVKENCPDIPFIYVSGTITEDIAIQSLAQGSTDYVLKTKLSRLAPAIKRALKESEEKRELKKAQLKIEESERRFRSLIENNSDGIVLINAESKIIYNSRSSEKILGYSLEELNEIEITDIIHSDDIVKIRCLIKDLTSETGKVTRFDLRAYRRNGDIIWLEVVGKNMFHDEAVKAIVINYHDISLRKAALEALIKAKQEAESSSKLKSILLTNINHEVRTPMNSILGFSELLLQYSKGANLKTYAEYIYSSGQRLMSTLESIITFAEMESNPLKIESHIISTTNLFDYVEETYKIRSTHSGVKFILGKDDNLLFSSDENCIKKVIDKVIENAFKFTKHGTISLKAYKEKLDDKEKVVIEVADTGIGIDKEKQDIIFEPFRQVSEGYNRQFEGFGLGLPMAKKYTEAMGGELILTSEVGVGTTIKIIFPSAEDNIKQAEVLSKDARKGVFNFKKVTHKGLPNILLVEDNLVNKVITEVLLKDFALLDYASDGITSIEMAKTKQYDMILMDINLKDGMGGIKAAKIIRKIPYYKDIPIAALTGYTSKADIERFFEAGLYPYIAKPVDKERLIHLIKTAIY